jgi:hypothetical protein
MNEERPGVGHRETYALRRVSYVLGGGSGAEGAEGVRSETVEPPALL